MSMQTSKKRKTAEASVSRKKRTSVEESASIVAQNSGEEPIGRATRQSLEAMKNVSWRYARIINCQLVVQIVWLKSWKSSLKYCLFTTINSY